MPSARARRLCAGSGKSLDLHEKVQIVLEMQRICLPLIVRHRRLAEWERPWAVTP